MLGKKDLFPIYGLWHKPFWQTVPFYVFLGFGFFFIVFLCLWLIIRKYMNRKVPKTSWQKATIDLENLKKRLIKKNINSQDFYLLLTGVIKKYLFNRFGYDLFGYTDKELILFLETKDFNKDLLENLENMFESIQLVKFAAKSAAKELMEKDLVKSFDLVEKTKDKAKN